MTQQAKFIDDLEYQHFTSPLYQKKFLKENVVVNTLYPTQRVQIDGNATTAPDMLTFVLPNAGLLIMQDCYLSFKIKLTCTGLQLETGDYIYQKNGGIYKSVTSGGTTTKTQILYAPMSARGFISDVQITKQNQNGLGLDHKQRNKFRDTMNYQTISQNYANTFSDYLLFNDDEKILLNTATTTNSVCYITYTVPLSELCVLLSIYPLFPMGILNGPLQLDIFTNQTALKQSATVDSDSISFSAYYDFEIRTTTFMNSKLIDELKMKPVHATFEDYIFRSLLSQSQNNTMNFQIAQKIKSLDAINIQAYYDRAGSWNLGWSNIVASLALTAGTKGIGGIQLEHNGVNMITKPINSLNDLYRINMQNGNAASDYNSGAPTVFSTSNFLNYSNQIQLKLDDFMGAEELPSAGFTGISIDPQSNTNISWNITDYTPTTQKPTQTTATTAINYDIFLYYSNMWKIENGDMFIITPD